jgi:hemoglobin
MPIHSPDTRHDVDSRQDCELLVREFYTRALADPVIGFLFTDVAHLDLEAHLPRIASFWETILLGAQTYAGGAFAPHAALNAKVKLRKGHFERWLWLWEQTVDELFTGERAELAKSHARRVAAAFHARLTAPPGAPPPEDEDLVLPIHGGTTRDSTSTAPQGSGPAGV